MTEISRSWLQASERALAERFDVLLLDLDGTVYRGASPIPGAAGTIASLRSRGNLPVFVTNNASRTPAQVAAHLVSLGVACLAEEVVTSGQAAGAEVATLVPPGSTVLVVGGDGLVEAVAEMSLVPVNHAQDVRAVVQGWSPDLAWPLLAEGAFALAQGVPWVVANTDLTLPTERGEAPGNGAFVELLSSVSGRVPDRVAGKPSPPLLQQAAARFPGVAPLVVGDRLDTDVLGATNVGLPSLLVLSGVTRLAELLQAPLESRPTFVGADLSALLGTHPAIFPSDRAWVCGSVRAQLGSGGELEVSPQAGSHPLDAVRAACAVAWSAADAGVACSFPEELLARLEASLAATR